MVEDGRRQLDGSEYDSNTIHDGNDGVRQLGDRTRQRINGRRQLVSNIADLNYFESIERAIEQEKSNTNKILKEIEYNHRQTLDAHMTHHEYLMGDAQERKDAIAYAHHKVMYDIYKKMKDNYDMSNTYHTN